MDFHSPEWLEVVDEINQRLIDLDKKNRGPLSEVETATVRGHIAALQSLLNWPVVAAIPIEEEGIEFE